MGRYDRPGTPSSAESGIMNVAQWTRGVLETFHDEWFNLAQLHAEVESRSGIKVNQRTVNRAMSRMVESGVVVARWDEVAPKVDGNNYDRTRKEYQWA